MVADILNLSQEDFEHVADIASEPSEIEKEPAELILAAINQGVIRNLIHFRDLRLIYPDIFKFFIFL